MKKTSIFIMSTALAFALTGCDDEFQNSQNDKGEVSENSTEQMYQTVFLTGDDITRTTLDENRKFYWTSGDVLWVDDPETTGKFVASTPLKFTEEKKDYAQFTVYKSFPAAITETQVYYTGQGSPSTTDGLKVTIKKYQTQTAPNDGSHIATDGDCGTVQATRSTTGNGFTFSLVHKAAYLLIYPYLDDTMGPNVTLKRIKITSTGSDDLTGTFSFTSAGLAQTADEGTGGKSITFYCDFTTPKPNGYGDDWTGFIFPEQGNKNSLADVGCYVVFHPGNHKLTLTYTYETTGEYEKREEFSIVRTLDEDVRPYEANTVRKVQHKTSHYDTYFAWDAEKWYGNGVVSYSTRDLQVHSPRPLDENDELGRWYNTTTVGTTAANKAAAVATHSAATMPCYNAMTWYLSTAYWDKDQEWRFFGRNGQAGLWLKKWEYIEGIPAGYTPSNCPTKWSKWTGWVYSAYFPMGKPADDVIDQYFFLPALGQNTPRSGNTFRLENHGSTPGSSGIDPNFVRYCFYWTSSPFVKDDYPYAYYMTARLSNYASSASSTSIGTFSSGQEVGYAAIFDLGYSRDVGCVAGVRPDGTPWFQ